MAAISSIASIFPPHHNSLHTSIFPSKFPCKTYRLRCNGGNPSTNSSTKQDSEPQNAFLKIAWYSSELLGIAASVFRSPSIDEAPERTLELAEDGSGAVDRAAIVTTIKEDFKNSYFVTGNLTLNTYEEDCEFADPAGSFKGLQRFKRNCTNFGSLLVKSDMKLMKWEDFEVRSTSDTYITAFTNSGIARGPFSQWAYCGFTCLTYLQDKGIGHWRFSCILSFPWRPILSATGYTEYYFDAQSGRVCRHVEHWNVPKMALFKQILKPSRGFGIRDQVNKWLKDIQGKSR